MNYDDFPIRSRIIGSASLARRNATDVPSSPSTNHDYVPIIVMTVIVLTIIGIFFLLAYGHRPLIYFQFPHPALSEQVADVSPWL